MTSNNNKANKSVHFEESMTKKAQPLQAVESKKSTGKEKQPHQAKPNNSTHQPLKSDSANERKTSPTVPDHCSCFHTTGFIIGNDICVEASHVLLDTGATSSFINLEATRQAKLTVRSLPPKVFDTAGGRVIFNKCAEAPLCIAGVKHTLLACIDEDKATPNRRNILLGMPGLVKFGIVVRPHTLADPEVGATIKSDTGLQRAMRRGQTAVERKAHKEAMRKKAASEKLALEKAALEKAQQKLRETEAHVAAQ
ncbi:hypothetical protein M409DRAFT_28087 [Zasmidium cellare ATCC 36951]|uniref:Uncharacterized protein n=1 Tax=Zasmidium cellare ATCC 36951 TaxID=1080233 RepID=A0A6A6C2T2_ZASCE|nr:uncharacterized protein M409DRAFT_28087 [Zasmidium cellare ATCC 36951]KAF2161351.1 hypothetical protein M409DRAFT_28087 [Zasmidium cellare ATCC 36951]